MSTKKQHYIPRMILKHHTFSQIPMAANCLWQYDKRTNQERCVNIRDICREKNLYEFKDNNEQIIESTRNVNEQLLSRMEKGWDKILNQICDNPSAPLNKSDSDSIYYLFAEQLLRTPEMLNFTANHISHINSTLSAIQATNMARIGSIPNTYSINNDSFLAYLFSFLYSLKLIVLHTSKTFILNGNRPILCLRQFSDTPYQLADFFFPFSSNICLGLTPTYTNSHFYETSDKFVACLNGWNFTNQSRFVYSQSPLSSVFPFISPSRCII